MNKFIKNLCETLRTLFLCAEKTGLLAQRRRELRLLPPLRQTVRCCVLAFFIQFVYKLFSKELALMYPQATWFLWLQVIRFRYKYKCMRILLRMLLSCYF